MSGYEMDCVEQNDPVAENKIDGPRDSKELGTGNRYCALSPACADTYDNNNRTADPYTYNETIDNQASLDTP